MDTSERKDRSEGIQCVEGPERTRRREGREALERRGGDESGKGGERGREAATEVHRQRRRAEYSAADWPLTLLSD